MDMYDYPSDAEVRQIVSNLTWTKQGKQRYDDRADDGQSVFIESFYSAIQTWGVTDYKDHRKDSLAQLRKLIEPCLRGKHGSSQRGQYYDSDGNPVRVILVRGYLGGYTGRFLYPSGITGCNRQANRPTHEVTATIK